MHDISFTVVQVPVDRLRPNPRNKEVHADFDPHGRDSWLVEDIRKFGVIMPALVYPNGVIDDGHRRWCSAKYLKQPTIPAIELRPTDENAAFSSAQLARQLTLYAKCVLYRAEISNMIERGKIQQERNLRLNMTSGQGATTDDSNLLHQEWIKFEEVLNISRRNLISGVKLLEQLDELRASGDPAKIDLANRTVAIFRNRGLRPALRMVDEPEPASDDMEPDCGAWRGEEDEQPKNKSRIRKRGPVKEARKQSPAAEPWQTTALKYLGQIQSLARKNGCYTVKLRLAMDEIEAELAPPQMQERRAA